MISQSADIVHADLITGIEKRYTGKQKQKRDCLLDVLKHTPAAQTSKIMISGNQTNITASGNVPQMILILPEKRSGIPLT